MRNCTHPGLTAAFILAWAAAGTAQDVPVRPAKIDWLTDLGVGERTAQRTGKPLLLVFR